ncbi:MAG: ComEC/Rec2 family competence protein, partial [FCB group bacterium]|nr:ComEC/Rec2 family competence protein [FCB group bacterium]
MRSDSRTRPALKIAGAFAAGICLIKIAPHALPVWIIIAGIPLFSIAAVLSKRYWRIQGNLFLSAAIFLAGALSSQRQIDNYRDNPLQIFAAEEAVIAFHAIALEDAGLFGEGSAVTVKVESYFYDKEYHFLGGKCLLILKEANRPGILFGDILTGEGRLKIIKPPSNPGQYDFSEHNFRRGITTYLECGTIPSIERSDKFSLMRNIIYPLRRDIIRKLEDFIGGGQAEILKGLTLGLRGGFDDKLKSDLRESGLWHLVSLSGMHIAIVSALLAFALTVIRTPYRLKDWLIIAGIIFYILIAETRAPMVRAGLIISLLILARRMGRYTDHWNLLGFAALVILIFNPAELFSAGFQLSFTAAAFIMAGYQNIYGLLGGNKNFVRQKRVMRYLIGLIA